MNMSDSNCLNNVITSFLHDVQRREDKGILRVSKREKGNAVCIDDFCAVLSNSLDGYVIEEGNRKISFNLSLFNNRYLQFATIEDVVIAMDVLKRNEAKEWDILNFNTKYLITKTLGSFLNNKVWAWLDRGRRIWEEECYNNQI